MAFDRNRPLKIDPTKKYWRVIMYETVGTGKAAVNIQCIMHDIPAETRGEAGMKALIRYMQKNKGGEPKLQSIDLEHYSRPIQL